MKLRTDFALVLVLAAAPAMAGGPGTTGGIGLKLPAGARPAAMGGAFAGLADDLSALYWNPAGLASITAPDLSFMHTQYLADTNYEVMAYGQPIGVLGTVAGSLNLLSYGNLPRTLERTDGMYGGLFGQSSPQDLFLTAGWGSALPPLFGLDRIKGGAAAKFTFQQLSGGTLVGVGITGGALWDTPVEGLRVGTLVDNLGALAGEGRLLPLAWAVGTSYATVLGKDFHMVWALDTRLAVDTAMSIALGVEITAFDLMQVRGGWHGGGALGGPSLGVGVRHPFTWFQKTILFKLDYAMVSSGELGSSNRFALGMQFGGVSTAVQLGRVQLVQQAGEPVLTWKGAGPAYQVWVRKADDAEFFQLTDRPIEEASYALLGLPSGAYVFRIVTVDPYRTRWKGPTSADIELTIEAPPAPPTPATPILPAPAASTTTAEPYVPPALPHIGPAGASATPVAPTPKGQ